MSAVLQEFAEALLDPARAVPEGLNGQRAGVDAKRFAVYRNNVFVSLVGALQSRFPVTCRLVGEEFFRGMARVYAGGERPASPVLMHYGDSFPGFIRGFAPAAALPYLGDVAELEACWTDAYHAADAAPLELAALAGIAPDQLGGSALLRHPSAALVRSGYPAGSIWSAHQEGEVRPMAQRNAETVLIVRPAHDVVLHVLPPGDAAFAMALLDGRTIAEAAKAAAPGLDVGEALVGLVSLGAFAEIWSTQGGIAS